jgi:hypothetical protein
MLSNEGDFNASVAAGKGSVVIAGKTFLIDPISDQITGTLHNYFRRTMKTPLAAIADSLKGLPEDLQKFAIAEAVKMQANGGAEGNGAFYRDAMLSDAGCAFLFWLLAKKNHPELTHEACIALVKQATPEVVMGDLATASGLVQLGGDSGN